MITPTYVKRITQTVLTSCSSFNKPEQGAHDRDRKPHRARHPFRYLFHNRRSATTSQRKQQIRLDA